MPDPRILVRDAGMTAELVTARESEPKECEACAYWTAQADGRSMVCPDHLAAKDAEIGRLKLRIVQAERALHGLPYDKDAHESWVEARRALESKGARK